MRRSSQLARTAVHAIACIMVFPAPQSSSQTPPAPPQGTPTLHVASRLAFLDVTVLDRKGRPIVSGLTQDDFLISEDKKPQRIFSFEAPETHRIVADDPANAPLTIFVLDQLNSSFEEMALTRSRLHKYLAAQPDVLSAPAEMLLLGNTSLELVQTSTRSKAVLLDAIDHLPPALSWKLMQASFSLERLSQSIDALQQIALQSKGVPGRKNIVWIGHGGPSLNTATLISASLDKLNQYIHDTANLLVEARVSLFLIYPGLPAGGPGMGRSEMSANHEFGEDDPFAGDINFGVFVNETGGQLFYNRNDVDAEVKRSIELGSLYYTLTYQPPDGSADGRFRRVRVTLHDPALRVITKTGYFAPSTSASADPRQQTMVNLNEAVRSTIPFDALRLSLVSVIRHPDTGTAEVTVDLSSNALSWQTLADGTSTTEIGLEAVSLTSRRDVLAWKTQNLRLSAPPRTPAQLAALHVHLVATLRIPPKTHAIRLAVGLLENGRTGAVELDRKAIDAAPEAATPATKLQRRASP